MKTNRHISDTDVDSFRSGALSAENTILCAEHIEVCSECNKRLDNALSADKRSRPLILDFSPKTYLKDAHLDYEQLSDYLEDKLDEDEVEIIRIHTELCPGCRKDLLNLKEFRKAIEPELKLRYGPPSRLKGLIEFLKSARYERFTFAYATLLILCVIGYLVAAIHFRENPNPIQNAVVPPGKIPVKVEEIPIGREKNVQPLSFKSSVATRKPNSHRRPDRDETKGVYDNGHWYGLDHKSNPKGLQVIPSDMREEVSALLRGQDIPAPVLLNELADPYLSGRRAADSQDKLRLLSPVGTFIKEDRPLFSWSPVSGATSYIIEIVDDGFNSVAQSPSLNVTEWLAASPLGRDKIYLWQVFAFKDGEMIEEQVRQTGRFKIISADKLSEIERARRRYSSHIALGVFYYKEGLLAEADREFQELLRKNPNSELAQNISRKIRSRPVLSPATK